MIVACIADTHGREGWEIPACDVFIHAGDITAGGTLDETTTFATMLHLLLVLRDRGTKVIIVPGNHDRCFQESEGKARAVCENLGFHVLIDQGITIDGHTFWGSPWTPPFMQWSFMKTEEELVAVYEKMPENIDVLITHGPPKGILDPGHDGSQAGSVALKCAITPRHVQHHVFGHLHAAGGKEMRGTTKGTHHTQFHNVAAVDEAYNLVRRQPLVFEI